MKRIEELTLQLLDGELRDEGAAELASLLEESEENRRVHLHLMEQEAALRGARSAGDLAPGTLARIRGERRDRVEEVVMTRLRAAAGEGDRAGPSVWRWFSSAAALLVCVALVSTARIYLRTPSPVEAYVYGQTQVTPGEATDFRVFVRDGSAGQPLAGAIVMAGLYRSGNGQAPLVWSSERVVTDQAGLALVSPHLPADAPEGDYTLTLRASGDAGAAQVKRSLQVRRSFRVLLTTDKPLYQPGQLIHMRALALATADRRPVAGREVVLAVHDPKGNQVFRRELQASEFGLVAADFRLARQVNQGEYRLSATVGDTTSERTVKVEQYVLPRFRIEVSTTRPYYEPGDTLRGEIVARYHFGEPVAGGAVELEGFTFVEDFRSFARVQGATDEEGRFVFEIPLPAYLVGAPLRQGDALVSLSATVTDTAGHPQVANLERVVTAHPIRIDVIPESGEVVAGVANQLYIVTTYADGRPAPAKLELSGAISATLPASDSGVVTVDLLPAQGRASLNITARDGSGTTASVEREWSPGDAPRAILLRTDRAVYQTGETALLTVLAPGGSGRVFVDVVKDRRTVLTRGLDMREGRAELALDLPHDLFGTLEMHAYRIEVGGEITADARIICVNRASDLVVDASLDGDSFRPGETAVLSFRVTSPLGDPVVSALSVSAVDEAVFALQEMRPGLERVYFALQAELLEPRYQLTGQLPITAGDLLEPGRVAAPASEQAAGALFALAGGGGDVLASESTSYQQNVKDLRREQQRSYARLVAGVAIVVTIVFFVLVALILVYSLGRQWTRTRAQGRTAVDGGAASRGTLGSVVGWWIAGTWSPLFAGALAGWAFGRFGAHRLEGAAAITACSLAFTTCLMLLVAACRRGAARARERGAPLFARHLRVLPAVYVTGVASVFLLILASNMRDGLRGDAAGWLAVAVIGCACLSAGMVAATGATALGSVGPRRWLWIAASRVALALSPLILVALLMFSALGAKTPGALLNETMGMATGADGSAFPVPTGSMKAGWGGDPAGPPRVRRHFPETLLWVPELITGEDGTARLEVPLADQITTWRVAASAVSAVGELGATQLPIKVFQDFFIELDLPVAMTQGDSVTVPVAVYNYLDGPQEVRVELGAASWFELGGERTQTITLAAGSVGSVEFSLTALIPGSHTLAATAIGGSQSDALERTVRVEPDGRAVTITRNGRLDENVMQRLVIPDEAIEGSLDLLVKVYPGAFSQVLEGLDGILQMPSGCFEQTSSTTYPNVLVLDYLRRTGLAMPEAELRALEYIGVGYQRLLSYEVRGGGFEWFGKTPAHVVLTAYGLMEFCDMARVADVDPAVIERTRDWLLARRRQDGSWAADSGHGGGAVGGQAGDDLRTTAYVARALLQAGVGAEAMRPTLDYLAAHVREVDDPYTLALCALVLPSREPPEFYDDSPMPAGTPVPAGAKAVMESATVLAGKFVLGRLDELRVEAEGLSWWLPAGQGVTHSRGDVLAIETTALAALAYLQEVHDLPAAHRALAWLVEQKDSRGTWHSTQATVAAMRALLEGSDPTSAQTRGRVPVTIAANGKAAAELVITEENASVFHLFDLRDFVQPGENVVALEAAADAALAYQVAASYHVPWAGEQPPSRDEPLTITVTYDATELAVDDRLVATATLTYRGPGSAAMTLVDLGIPPGFDLETSDFEALRKQGEIERFEATGRQVTVYLRELPPGEPLTLKYSMRARYPVRVKTPPSTAYQYYQPEVRSVAAPVTLVVR